MTGEMSDSVKCEDVSRHRVELKLEGPSRSERDAAKN